MLQEIKAIWEIWLFYVNFDKVHSITLVSLSLSPNTQISYNVSGSRRNLDNIQASEFGSEASSTLKHPYREKHNMHSQKVIV